jgi:hypothetical protein
MVSRSPRARPSATFDWVDVTDEIADRGVWGGEVLAEALASVPPGDRQVVPGLRCQTTALGADRLQRIVVDLHAGDHRDPLVQQPDQRPDEPGLALAPFTEQD